MDNQHQLIKGYRDLSAEEVALMNRIKEEGGRLQQLIDDVHAHLTAQSEHAFALKTPEGTAELRRIDDAEPRRWCSIAKTNFQTGLMALTRAVAQPGSF